MASWPIRHSAASRPPGRRGGPALAADSPPASKATSWSSMPDPTIYDGRFANNGWLQELPKPITELTWDNAAIMSPATARDLGVGKGSYAHGGEHGGYHQPVVELQLGDDGARRRPGSCRAMPTAASPSIWATAENGQAGSAGRQAAKSASTPIALRTLGSPLVRGRLERPTAPADTYLVACTQQHHLMENREVVRAGTLAEYQQHTRDFASEPREAGAA